MSFTFFQVIEYSDAPFKFTGGVYPSVFFLATGFHGFHVIVGTLFLIVCWFRARDNQFTPERHFGFEAAAWYWHFVDVVWLFLFVAIYWWGQSAVTAG
jgi:cytochrome c oxidase subunit 3